MLKVALGHSDDIDLDKAVADVIEQVRVELGDTQLQAALLFMADSLRQEHAISKICAAFPGIKLAGCSSAGEATSRLGFREDSILLVCFCSDDVQFAIGYGEATSTDPAAAARQAYEQIKEQLEPDCSIGICFCFSDAVDAVPDATLNQLIELTGGKVPIMGGAAASYHVGSPTYVYHNERVLSDAIVLMALSGNLKVSMSTENSWQPVGKSGQVTSAKGNIIYTIDGKPALDFYRDRVGDDTQTLVCIPIAVVTDENNISIRGPMAFDEVDRSIKISGSVQEGDIIRLSYADVSDVQKGANKAIQSLTEQFSGTSDPSFVFFCSCAARKMYLALDVRDEIEQISDTIGRHVPVAGFYGFGEIGGASITDKTLFQNQAITSVAIG